MNKKIKAVFFDFDGTLFYSDKMTRQTQRALQILRSKGILLFLATGRHRIYIPMDKNFPFQFDAYITMNGQLSICREEIIDQSIIPQSDIDALLMYLRKTPLPTVFLEKDSVYTNTKEVHWFQKYYVSNIEQVIHKDGIYQVVLFATRKQEKEILQFMPECRATRWNDEGIDIIGKNGSKQVGIEKVLEYFHLSADEVMAFGDGLNDLEMIENAGIGVAMGNAVEPLKQVADYVCESVDKGGIYQALEYLKIL